MIGRTIVLFLFLFSLAPVMATVDLPEIDSINFHQINRRDGLPKNGINDIVQDQRGFIWIGTSNGLSRYDGQRVFTYQTSFNDKKSISGNDISSIAVDSENKIWVATNTTLDFYTYQQDKFTHIIDNKKKIDGKKISVIHRVLEDNHKNIFISTNLGLIKTDLKGKTFKLYKNNSTKLLTDRPIRIFKTRYKNFFISSYEDGLWVYKKSEDKFVQFIKNLKSIEPRSTNIKDIVETKNGDFWATTTKGLLHLSADGEIIGLETQIKSKKFNTDSFFDIEIGRNDKLIVSTGSNGLYQLDLNGTVLKHITKMPNNRFSLPSNITRKLFMDKNEMLWVGTENSGIGLLKQTENLISRIDYQKNNNASFLDTIVWSIKQDSRGRLWVGTDSGLNLWDGVNPGFKHFIFGKSNSGSNAEVSSISEPMQGLVWVATGIGLRAIDISKQAIVDMSIKLPFLKELYTKAVYNVFVDSKKRLWVVHDNGVSLINFAAQNVLNFTYNKNNKKGIPDNEIGSLTEDENGTVWLGTSKGVCAFLELKKEFNCVLTDEGGVTAGNTFLVNGLVVKDNILWVGYSGNGLIRLDLSDKNNKPQHFTTNNGFPSDDIASLAMDKKGRLWMSSQTGLIVYNPMNGQIINLRGRDGTGDSEFNEGAFTRLNDGRFAFGTIKGVVIVDVNKFEFKKTKPTVKFSGAFSLTDNKLYSMGKFFQMPENNSGLILAFSNQDYFHPEQSLYQYRRGENKKWIDLKNKSEISFDGFSWGEHEIQVRGKYLGGDWGPINSISFYAYPPSWRSGFALILYASIALSLLFGFLYYRYSQTKEKYRMLNVIKENEQQLRLSLDASQQGVWDWRIDHDHMERSKTDELLHLQTPETLVDYWALIEDRDRLSVINAWNAHLFGHSKNYYCQYRMKVEGDEEIWIEEQGRAIDRDESEMATHITGTYRNITEAKMLEKKLNLLAKAFEDTAEGVLIVDYELTIVQVNKAVTEITGYAEEILIGKSIKPTTYDKMPLTFYDEIWQEVAEKGLWHGEVWQTNSDGEDIPLWLNVSDIQYESEQETYYVLIISDIRERKETEEELRYLANYDTLTKLPNRALLRDRLDHGLNNAKRQNRPVAILFLDLDRFKHVNDSFGHSVGDGLLIAVAKRLQSCLRDDDTVSRIGGDEFVILMEHFSSINAIAGVTEKIRKEMSTPFNLEGVDIQASFSVGVSVFPGDGEDSATLLRNADTAMYHAKSAGRNRVQFYAPKMNESALERLTLENDLRGAIGSGQLEVYYQPQICNKDNSFYGVEALVRWNHPERGQISPIDFIPMAEESDLIVSLGNEVLYKACLQMKKWQDKFGLDMKVSINLAARQLLQLDLAQHIENVVLRAELEPKHVCLEITETAVMEDLDRSRKILNSLRGKGFKIAIDDFGTGYSSLNYLRNIPLDILKIDYTFVRDLLENTVDQAIVSAIIEIGEALDLQVLAEGIEMEEQRVFLSKKGCEYFQGYLFGRPMPADDFEKMLTGRNKILEDG